MARPAKPIDYQTGVMTKAERERRQRGEAEYRGKRPIREEPPESLSEEGKEVYLAILRNLPLDKLNETDGYTVEVVADAIAMMRECRRDIQHNGLFVTATNKAGEPVRDQNKAVIVYQKYSEILKKYTAELGLSPVARSRIANMAQEEEPKRRNILLDLLKDEDEDEE